MKIYMVAGASDGWRASGYGAALLAGGNPLLLVSFVEFTKRPAPPLAVKPLPPYVPSNLKKEPDVPAE